MVVVVAFRLAPDSQGYYVSVEGELVRAGQARLPLASEHVHRCTHLYIYQAHIPSPHQDGISQAINMANTTKHLKRSLMATLPAMLLLESSAIRRPKFWRMQLLWARTGNTWPWEHLPVRSTQVCLSRFPAPDASPTDHSCCDGHPCHHLYGVCLHQ